MEREKPSKLYNKRNVAFIALFLIFGIFCIRFPYFVSGILLFSAAVFLFILVKTKSLGKGAAIALAAVLLFGYFSAFASLTLYNSYGPSGEAEIQARVISVSEIKSDSGEISYGYLADHIRANGKRYGGKISFYSEKKASVGDRVRASGKVEHNDLSFDSAYSAMQYRTGAKFSFTPSSLSFSSGKAPFSYSVREKVRSILVDAQGKRAGSFAYAMLFGDSSEMLYSDKQAMRSVGVAHVFAVSGLHVGVLSSVILFLLKKLKCKGWVNFAVLLPILGFYAYLSSFTPSVLRASIMTLVFLAANALGARYDAVSSLSLAAILILLFRPLYLFDVSFILSFLSVFGIVSLTDPLEKIFLRHGMKKGLASPLALSIATSVSIAPVSAVFFGRISFAGIALNLVVVPLASLSYVLTLAALLLTLVYSGFGTLLAAFRFIPLFIAELSIKVSAFGLAQSYAFSVAEVAVYYGALALVGKQSLLPRRVKLITAGIVTGVMMILIFV